MRLHGSGPRRRAVYLLGDVFDAWIGDDQLREPLAERVALGLRGVANAGVPVGILTGNRDFLLGERFTTVAGAVLLPEQLVINLAGTPTLLLHGDELCTGDMAYQKYRAVMRNPKYQRPFLALPYFLRRGAASLLRRQSQSTSPP
jgi:UDP-2,3-diacylglucosamine hydrolase